MNAKFYLVFALVAALFGFVPKAHAQDCVPAPQVQNQPQRCHDGRIITGWQHTVNEYGRRISTPVGFAPSWPTQQFLVGGQHVQYVVAPSQHAANQGGFSACTVLGGGIGGVFGNVIDNHGAGGTVAGAVIGGALGSLICSNNSGQRVVVMQPQGQAGASRGISGVFCNIDGVVTKEADDPTCEAKAKAKAETLGGGTKTSVKSQPNAPVCGTGKTWTKLNWPGHHQHDTFVCLPDGDPHRY